MLDPTRLYTIEEARAYTGCGRSSVYRAIRNGRLRAVKTGRHTKLLGKDISSFVSSLPALGGFPAHSTP